MSEPKVHPQPRIPGRSKAIMLVLMLIVLAVGGYAVFMMRGKPAVDVTPPGAGLTTDGSR